MKRFLPFFLLSFFVFSLLFFFSSHAVFAQLQQGAANPPDGTWVNDSEVTFVGKVGARSGNFLDWAIEGYKWTTDSTNIKAFWTRIRDIVYVLCALFILVTAFVMIVTRGRSITIRRFLPRFALIILLVTFSFSLIQLLYQVTDIIQGFFFKNPIGKIISQKDLLHVGFDYEIFSGYRKFGASFDEAAFVSLLLVKLTALTYYAMVGILLLRKIILWFFIIISPVFPLLLLYYPVRNTAKIWIGEFFRWLLYAPIFAIFLSGLVWMWSRSTPTSPGIPIAFNLSGVGTKIVYPTAVNILLGGPGQQLSLTNSVNLRDTFALYVVALLMLWVVILLPWILLQIFLDYLHSFSLSENTFVKQLIGSGSSFFQKTVPPSQPPPKPPPVSFQPAGMAKPLPVGEAAAAKPVQMAKPVQTPAEIMRLTNLSIPTMRDVARFETATLSSTVQQRTEVGRVQETLQRIGNPNLIASPFERQRYNQVRDNLLAAKKTGNPIATSILSAASHVAQTNVSAKTVETNKMQSFLTNLAHPETTISSSEQATYTRIQQQLRTESQKGNQTASAVLTAMSDPNRVASDPVAAKQIKEKLIEAKEKNKDQLAAVVLDMMSGGKSPMAEASLPVINKIQTVNLDDYEAVKKMWVENYQKIDPPATDDGVPRSREGWIKDDVTKMAGTISLLTSGDPQKVNQGMSMVSKILPILLIGGFSQTEVVTYLKAKLEAARGVFSETQKKQEEEESMVETKRREEKPKEMTMEAVSEEKDTEKEDKANGNNE